MNERFHVWDSRSDKTSNSTNEIYCLHSRGGYIKKTVMSWVVLSSLSKHLPSADAMSFNVDVDELENSHGATYVRKKAAKIIGENLPKEPGWVLIGLPRQLWTVHKMHWSTWKGWACTASCSHPSFLYFLYSQGEIKKKKKKKKGTFHQICVFWKF